MWIEHEQVYVDGAWWSGYCLAVGWGICLDHDGGMCGLKYENEP